MIEKDKLKEYAGKLMFDMEEGQYDKLQDEFDVMLKQMDLIDDFPNISEVEPMTFPFINDEATFREDEASATLEVEEALKNAKDVIDREIKVPKVVG